MTRLIPDWEIRITNFGLGYVLMCLLVAIGATNTGNNGLYLVLAGMLSAMVVSGIVSRRNVRGVQCEIEPVGEVVAGRPALLKIRFENRHAAATAQGLFFLHEGLPGPLWVASIVFVINCQLLVSLVAVPRIAERIFPELTRQFEIAFPLSKLCE